MLTLIGSSKVADHLKKLHPNAHRLRAILGLDAKNAAIVLPDADIELAVKDLLIQWPALYGAEVADCLPVGGRTFPTPLH